MKIFKHKKLIILIIIVIVIVILGILVLKMFLKTDDSPIYGNRLDGIEDIVIASENITNLEKDISEFDLVESVSYRLEGRLINIIIKVDDTLDLDTFKGYALKTLEYFTDEEKLYYDIQIFGDSSNETSEVYPVIGYKDKNAETLVW